MRPWQNNSSRVVAHITRSRVLLSRSDSTAKCFEPCIIQHPRTVSRYIRYKVANPSLKKSTGYLEKLSVSTMNGIQVSSLASCFSVSSQRRVLWKCGRHVQTCHTDPHRSKRKHDAKSREQKLDPKLISWGICAYDEYSWGQRWVWMGLLEVTWCMMS